MQQKWRLLCKQPPKGFEKFFKPGYSYILISYLFIYYTGLCSSLYEIKEKLICHDAAFIGGAKNAENVGKKAEEASSKKASTQKPSSTSTPSSGSKDSGYQWTFKFFGDGAQRGGKSFEGGDKDKTFMIVGALGITGILAYIFSQDLNQKEITWREFTYK